MKTPRYSILRAFAALFVACLAPAFLFHPSSVRAEWTRVAYGGILTDVFMLTASNGWAVGGDGRILKTTDGGITWVSRDVADHDLEAVHFNSLTHGVAVGTGGIIMRTTDGGDHWTSLPGGQNADLFDIQFTGSLTGWATGTSGRIFKTADGGLTWTMSDHGSRDLRAVYFVDATHGWAVGDGGEVLRTADGSTWENRSIAGGRTLHDVFFLNQTTGWAAATAGGVYRTTDGGNTWNLHLTGGQAQLYGVRFTDAQNGVVAGQSNRAYRSADGGVTWTVVASLPGDGARDFYSLHFVDGTNAWVCGAQGRILKTADAGLTWTQQTGWTVEELHGVYLSDRNRGWICGGDAQMADTSDGGTTWTLRTVPTTPSGRSIHDVQFFDAARGWHAGQEFRRTTDGGLTWQESSPGVSILDSHFVDAETGWVAGLSATIRKTTDGGVTWIPQNVPGSGAFNGIHFPTRSTGCAAGANGLIVRTEDAGATWVQQTSGTTQVLNDVIFISEQTGWAATNGSILKTTDGGNHWRHLNIGTTATIHAVHFIDAHRGWAVGNAVDPPSPGGSTILRTEDGGTTWEVQNFPSANRLNNVMFTSPWHGCAVGQNGTVLVYDVPPPEMAVLGNGVEILNGDTTPSQVDHTDFTGVSAEEGSIARIFTVRCAAGEKLRLTGSPRVTIGGAHAANFTVTSPPAAQATPGADATFTITFDPLASGVRTARVAIPNDDPDKDPFVFNIQGTGLLPTLTVTGRVTDCVTLAGIAGVQINVSGAAAQAVTDGSGNYTINSVPGAETLQIVTSRDGAVFEPPVQTFSNPSGTLAADFCARFDTSRLIRGSIRHGSGAGISGVVVQLTGAATATAHTDSRGSYEFVNLPAGNFSVAPAKADWTFAPASSTFTTLSGAVAADFTGTYVVLGGGPAEPGNKGRIAFSPQSAGEDFFGTGKRQWPTMVVNDDGSGGAVALRPGVVSPGADAGHAWTRDGSRLAFSRQTGLWHQIHLMNADGSGLQQLTWDNYYNTHPVWSPDGTRVAYLSLRNAWWYLVIRNVASGAEQVLTGVRDLCWVTWSPDGAQLAFTEFVNARARLYRIGANGSGRAEIPTPETDRIRSVAWSPDGTRLVYGAARNNGGAWQSIAAIIPVAGGTPAAVVPDISNACAAWSPDSTRITYNRGGSIFTATAAGADERLVLANAGKISPHSWGPPHHVATASGSGSTVQSGGVTVRFNSVSSPGNTTVVPVPGHAWELPAGYVGAGNFGAWEIASDAAYTGPVVLTFSVPSVADAAVFFRLRVLHGENGVLVDRTILAPDTPAPDFATRLLSARVTSLSPFVIAERITAPLPQVTGLIVDRDGEPVSDVTVTLTGNHEATAVTGIDGAFLFVGLTNGAAYTLTASDSRYVFSPSATGIASLSAGSQVRFIAAPAPPPEAPVPFMVPDPRFDHRPTIIWQGNPFQFTLESSAGLTSWAPFADPFYPVAEGIAVPLNLSEARQFFRLTVPQ